MLVSDYYRSAFSTRYGSNDMRVIWSESYKRSCWRELWLAHLAAQTQQGLAPQWAYDRVFNYLSALSDGSKAQAHLDAVVNLENTTRHDVVAELDVLRETTRVPYLHAGMTSSDVTDNIDVYRSMESMKLLMSRVKALSSGLHDAKKDMQGIWVDGYTHLQKARPVSLGGRFACYAQEVFIAEIQMTTAMSTMRGKGVKGPVGNYGSMLELGWTLEQAKAIEARVMSSLRLSCWPIASQTYPRIQDYTLLTSLATMAAALHKMAFDFRLMQSPGFGRILEEDFGPGQVGSSAMPEKRNPIMAENICSLCRYISVLPQVAWENAANQGLERTLDDSANRRIILPEAFLAMDEILIKAQVLIYGMSVHAC